MPNRPLFSSIDRQLTLDLLLEKAEEGLAVCNFEGGIVAVNRQFSLWCGHHSPEDILGKFLSDVLHDKKISPIEKMREELMSCECFEYPTYTTSSDLKLLQPELIESELTKNTQTDQNKAEAPTDLNFLSQKSKEVVRTIFSSDLHEWMEVRMIKLYDLSSQSLQTQEENEPLYLHKDMRLYTQNILEQSKINPELLERFPESFTTHPEIIHEYIKHCIIIRVRKLDPSVISISDSKKYIDDMTSMPNRSAFERDILHISKLSLAGTSSFEHDDAAEKRKKRKKAEISPLGLILFDISHFKSFNERLGHEMGDACLIEVGKRIKEHLQELDRAYRIGNDQFAVLCQNGPFMVNQTLESIEAALAKPLQFNQHDYAINVRAGVFLPDHYSLWVDPLSKAEQALTEAKRLRSMRAYYKPEHSHNAYDPEWLQEVRDAIENNQLDVALQPKIDLVTNKMIGAEALVRWTHPRKGVILPGEFLPLCEELGLLPKIDEIVLNKTCQYIRKSIQMGSPIKMCINLSAQSMDNPHMTQTIMYALQKYNIPTHLFGIEITETSVVQDQEAGKKLIMDLIDLGVEIAIDDFGMGYSSLSYLIKYPADWIKIDREFIRHLPGSNTHEVTVQNIINLAHGLASRVVAEGVETKECLDMVREMGCDVAQGYVFSPALGFSDLIDWLKQTDSWPEPEQH